ncbi:nucleoid-associated protein [Castellaniella sp. GW247-6E4]|uniref:nucleoid-associated protein n=1 Tax=Castellaniella sp. GW247-6E4 TaxID=3140380 RepID=UPI00331644C9
MSFENLSIGRIIIHEVFKRDEDRVEKTPSYGEGRLELPPEARTALQKRITEALGASSHGLEMAISDVGLESAWAMGKGVIASQGNDVSFVTYSQRIAAKLAAAQFSRSIPGGIVVVIDGLCGNPARSFMCIIKAESCGGFTKKQEGQQLTLQYLNELILTPQSKLYKIGAFLRIDPDAATEEAPIAGWKAYIFDDQITRGSRATAAQYFYERFLGLKFPSNSAFQTKQFFSLTRDFIRNAEVTPEKKVELLNALSTYLKADQTTTVRAATFAESYFEGPDIKDAYTAHMRNSGFPENAVHKDISEVGGQLKVRKIIFSKDIKFTAPADGFSDMVKIETIDGEAGEDGTPTRWTRITVKDHIRNQE